MIGRPGTVKSRAAPSKLKPSLHRIGSGRYLPHMTEAGTRVGPVRTQIDPSPLCNIVSPLIEISNIYELRRITKLTTFFVETFKTLYGQNVLHFRNQVDQGNAKKQKESCFRNTKRVFNFGNA